jgi:hypothetical protein
VFLTGSVRVSVRVDPTNPYAELLKTWGGLAGVVSLLVSIVVLLRGWYRDRSHLWFILKTDETERFFVRTIQSKIPNVAIGTATLVVSNNSSRPNAILEWSATTTDKNGKVHKIDMSQSELTDFGTLNAVPTTVAAFTAVEAHLMFLVDARTLPDPVVFHVKAKDRTKKVHRISVSIPNVLKNTLSGE